MIGTICVGENVVAGSQFLISARLDRDAESVGQHVERGGRSESATHGKQFTPEGTVEVLLDSRQVGRRLRIDPSQLPHLPHSLAPGSQTGCYLPRLKVSVALRYVRAFPWALEAWREAGARSSAPG
jgi:hypothetical protein